jgi:multidrug resistance efflux pump
MALAPPLVWVLALAAAIGLHHRRTATGVISGRAETNSIALSYSEPGIVRDVRVHLHDVVSPGQVVVTLDDTQEKIALDAVRTDIDRVTAEIAAERAKLAADNARALVDATDLARRYLVDRETARLEYLRLAMENARDRMSLQGAKIEYDINQRLYDEEHSNRRELNDTETVFDALKATVAEQEPLLAQAKAAYENADQRWAMFSQQYRGVETLYDPVLDPLRIEIDVRERDVQELVRVIDAHVIRSPIAGQITYLNAAPGLAIEAGAVLATVSSVSTNRVVAYATEESGVIPREGDAVDVMSVTSAGDHAEIQYPGVISSVSVIVQELPSEYWTVPTVPVWGRWVVVSLGESRQLIPGEKVTVAIPAGTQ